MTDSASASTRTSKVIDAPREALYQAFIYPAALVVWPPPGEMTGEIYSFDARVGGGYRMSLFYPSSDQVHAARPRRRKTALRHDSWNLRPQRESSKRYLFTQLIRPSQGR